MKNSLRKFLFKSTLTGILCSLWVIPSLAMQDDLEWQEALKRRSALKDHLKRQGYKKEDLLEVGKKFANSGYKLSSLTSEDLNVWARGARLGRLSALYNIGRFVSTQKEEGYEWDPQITKIIQRLKEVKNSSVPSILEQSLQHYLKTREVPSEYSEGQNLFQKLDENEVEFAHERKEVQTYLEYLEEIEIEKKCLEEKKRQEEESRQLLIEAEKFQKIAEERARVEEEEAGRRQAEFKLQEELIAKYQKLEEEFNKQLESRKKADEEVALKQAIEAKAKLDTELKATKEQFQKELTTKRQAMEAELEARKKAEEEAIQKRIAEATAKLTAEHLAAEEHFQKELADKKKVAEEIALKQAIEVKAKLDTELKATEEQFQKELATKRQAVEVELEARKKAEEEAIQKRIAEATAKLA